MPLNKYTFCALILLCMNMSGCAYLKKLTRQNTEDINLDSSLIQTYTQTLEYKEKFRAPFIASYNYGDKNLVYVAALHTDGDQNATHQTIKKAIEMKPHFLIVEGSAFSIISDPDDIAYANACLKKKFKNCGEDAFAVTEALKAQIPFSYGDPSDAAIHATLKKRFISDDELIAFYTLKNIPQWKRGEMKAGEIGLSWNKKLAAALSRASKKFRAKSTMTESKFKKVYKSKMGKDFNFDDITDETLRPQIDQNPKWSNKLAYSIDVLKNQFLVKQIELRLNKYKKVLVVYGSSTLIKHRPMLKEVFGDSTDSSIH